MKLTINTIAIGTRHRKDMGDLTKLAESIKTVGLLQSIGVTENNELIFGYRRLLACRDYLRWTEIDVRVFNIVNIATGEYTENEMRKGLVPSERAALLKTLERYSHGGDRRSHEFQGKNFPVDFLTKEQASKRVGFGNATTARHESVICEKGIPEVIEAVDQEELSIWAGYAVALQPVERQAEIIKLPKSQRIAIISDLDRPGGRTRRKEQPVSLKRTKESYRNPHYANHGTGLMKQLSLTDEESGRPSAGLAGQQHPDYPPGWNYHMVHVEEHGRVQVVPIQEKARQALFIRFNDLAVAVARLAEELPNPKEIPELGGTRVEKLTGIFDRNLEKAHRNLTNFIECYRTIKRL